MKKKIEELIIATLFCMWFGVAVGAGVALGFWALTLQLL